MYIPSYFAIDEREAFDLIEAHSFATLLSVHNGEPFATHLPMLLDRETRTLWGHVARANPQWHDLESQTALAIFLGDHHYISPTWYESLDHVPTWNYSAVHVYGRIALESDPARVHEMLAKLIAKYEASTSSYSIQNVAEKNLSGLMNGIVAFTLHIERIEAKAKMSQNHPVARRQSVRDALEDLGSESAKAVAESMRSKS
jgi:transcriptional regulator